MNISIPFSVFIFIELIAVSYGDIKYKKISNLWSIFNIGLFIFFLFYFPESYPFFWPHFIFPVAFFIAGLFLFLLKIMGGGDSKFLCTFFLLIPYHYQDDVFMSLLYSTIIIGGTLFLHNTLKNIDKLIFVLKTKSLFRLKEIYGTKFSYAPVILFSWIMFSLRGYLKI